MDRGPQHGKQILVIPSQRPVNLGRPLLACWWVDRAQSDEQHKPPSVRYIHLRPMNRHCVRFGSLRQTTCEPIAILFPLGRTARTKQQQGGPSIWSGLVRSGPGRSLPAPPRRIPTGHQAALCNTEEWSFRSTTLDPTRKDCSSRKEEVGIVSILHSRRTSKQVLCTINSK